MKTTAPTANRLLLKLIATISNGKTRIALASIGILNNKTKMMQKNVNNKSVMNSLPVTFWFTAL